jgi:uncharacterized protein (TIGR03083 family)
VPLVTMEAYGRSQEAFDAVLAAVPDDNWDAPSACARWTVRDVAGHVIWGQEQMRHWATGQEYTCTSGAPGAPHPGAPHLEAIVHLGHSGGNSPP